MIYETWKKWHECRDLILPSLALMATHTEDDILVMLAQGKLKLWKGEKSAIVSQIIDEPQMRVLVFFLAGGVVDELKMMAAEIEQYGIEQGCTMAEGTGRKGFASFFSDYSDGGHHYYKELSHA